MRRLSTRGAAKTLGIDHATLSNYLKVGKLPAPETVAVGQRIVHMWTEAEIEHVRQLLPKIANGRKTRYKKQTAPTTRRGRLSSQQSRQARHRSAKAKGKTKGKKKK